MTLTSSSMSLSDEGVVIAYYLNEYGGWEALPATSVFWDNEKVIYSTEFWYSFDKRGVYFAHINTKPVDPEPPQGNIDVKLVIIDRVYFNKININGHHISNYSDLTTEITNYGGQIHSANSSTKQAKNGANRCLPFFRQN